MIPDPTKILDKVTEVFDDNFYSEQEKEIEHTERYRLALNSDSWLTKANRPLNTMWTGLIWGIAVLWWFALWAKFGADFASDHWYVIPAVGAPYMTALGFLFNSRKQEKIAAKQAEMVAKKADAAVKIEAMKTKHELREDKRDSRQERKEERRK